MSDQEEFFIRELKDGIAADAKCLGEIARRLKLPTLSKPEERKLTRLQTECRARIVQLQTEINRLKA